MNEQQNEEPSVCIICIRMSEEMIKTIVQHVTQGRLDVTWKPNTSILNCFKTGPLHHHLLFSYQANQHILLFNKTTSAMLEHLVDNMNSVTFPHKNYIFVCLCILSFWYSLLSAWKILNRKVSCLNPCFLLQPNRLVYVLRPLACFKIFLNG